MSPAENTSLIGSLLVDISRILIISGATNPGVPHLTKRYFYSWAAVARPKSQITTSFVFSLLNIIFSGLRSRWMTFLAANDRKASIIFLMICWIYLGLVIYF